ncbi:hypothetical protein AAUPMC_09296 [Pasteurella multocida subsp. multocida str. Anand1_cattle]|nr:hypothetical protein AAUPMC_09296 [Pasteurella multocida subsp. multocida str. Anand1_cattle]
MLFIGERIAHHLNIGIPASIWGLLLLFLGLTFRIIKLDWGVMFSQFINSLYGTIIRASECWGDKICGCVI